MEVTRKPSEESSAAVQRSEAGRKFNASTRGVQLEKQKETADTTLSDRSASILDSAGTIGEKVSSYTDKVSWMVQSFIDENWAQFSALGAAVLLETTALVAEKLSPKGTKLSPESIQQAIENIAKTIEDREVVKYITLAIDVISHPEKNRDFDVTSDGSGAKLGKKDTLRQLKAGLERLNSMDDQGGQVAIREAKELITTAINVVQKKLNVSRRVKALDVAANMASIAANIAGVIGTSGASLAPWLVNVATANLASVGSIAQKVMGKTYAAEGEIFGGDVDQLSADGILSDNILATLKRCNALAIDVLTHPEKNRDFEDQEGVKLGKKETKRLLRMALHELDRMIAQNVTDPTAQAKLENIRQGIKTAYGIVGSKLRKARVTKGLKISGAVLATAAAVAAGVATFGVGTIAVLPAISASAGFLGTIISDAKLAREMLQSKHQKS
ncbi:MAG: hypothetical protein LBC11_03730 [Puniceicoccales bacterium]|jgi:hypothetical protein|nr:hypothetical protein [Puniceicoccales bacterium]